MKKIASILILLSFIVFLFFSLRKNSGFAINTFSNLPNELNGGSCVFSLNIKDFDNGKYVFVNDYANFGYSVINNEKENFTLEKYDTDKGIFNYENEKYNLEIHIVKSVSSGTESSKIGAILTITNKNNISVVRNVVGECGS